MQSPKATLAVCRLGAALNIKRLDSLPEQSNAITTKAPARAGAEREPMGSDMILRGESTLLGFLFFALGNQGHALLLGELDLKPITRDQIQQSGVGLANQ